jgi:hypothetical protein
MLDEDKEEKDEEIPLIRKNSRSSKSSVGVSDPGDPQPSRPVNLSLRIPAQMGWRKMEHKGECGL